VENRNFLVPPFTQQLVKKLATISRRFTTKQDL